MARDERQETCSNSTAFSMIIHPMVERFKSGFWLQLTTTFNIDYSDFSDSE